MKRFSFLLMLLLVSCFLFAQHVEPPASPPVKPAKPGEGIEWLSWEQAVAKMEKEPRLMMIDVYTDWCGWCKRMDATTMQSPSIIKIIQDKYYAVKMDAESRKDIVFRGRTYKFIAQGHRGYHELPAELLSGKMSYPTLVFLDQEFAIIQPLPGYQEAAGLEPILAYFGGGFYKNTPWETFSQSYKPLPKASN